MINNIFKRCLSSAASNSNNSNRVVICDSFFEPLKVVNSSNSFPSASNIALKENEVRIRPEYGGVNFADVLMIKGKYQVRAKPPFTPGFECAGTVIETKSNSVKVGDKCFSFPLYGAFGPDLICHQDRVIKLPSQIKILEADSMFLVTYGTAHMALRFKARVKKGDVVLITASSGGVGLAACQIAKQLGCVVIGLCSKEKKESSLSNGGCDYVFSYDEFKGKASIADITKGNGLNVVIDMVGGNELNEKLIKCLAWEGQLCVIGFASGEIPSIKTNQLLLRNASVHGVFWGDHFTKSQQILRESSAELIQWYVDKKIKPHVFKEYTIDQVNDAFKVLEGRKTVGKVVIKLD